MSELPIYYLVISAVVCASLLWIRQRAVQKNFEIRLVLDLSLCGLIFGFLGARLFHVIYEYPEIYIKEPWRIVDFGRGGYVYYGGLIAGLIAVWYFLKFLKTTAPESYFDLAAPVISFGYATGRIACLLSGCCYGPITEMPWGILLQDETGLIHRRHPTPLYATLLELCVLFFILRVEKKREQIFSGFFQPAGRLFFLWLLLHSVARFFIEFFRDDFRGPQFFFSISAWISLLLAGFALYSLRGNRNVFKINSDS